MMPRQASGQLSGPGGAGWRPAYAVAAAPLVPVVVAVPARVVLPDGVPPVEVPAVRRPAAAAAVAVAAARRVRSAGPAVRPARGRKSKKQRRQEFDQMEAPSIGGVRVKSGDGQTVRLARGASLTDLAEKIGVDAASLVQVLFHLGEMVTATQSVSDDTLQVLGAELNYDIEVVSPEDEDRELLESFDIEFGENEVARTDLAGRDRRW